MLRIHLLDVLRGISVSAMIVYHFFWDLGYFGFIELENITRGLPLFFAQCIGASFIIISGISLRLASYSSNFSTKFLKRLLVLVLICLAITSITFYIDKKSFIFFGILHFLVTCSLLGLLSLKIQNNKILFILFVCSLVVSVSKIKFDLPSHFSWLGLNSEVPITNDFYPLFPWVSFYFFGLWVSKPLKICLIHRNSSCRNDYSKFFTIYKGLQILGRNSLTIYILHQPIFFSLLLIFIRISS
tara:strand:+ start:75 stop:803 length:729 start_codon:yes stop_codon:yes gene_type:complete